MRSKSEYPKRLLLFGSAFIVHTFLSWQYGQQVPWGGDEWFSYRDFTVSGLPFSIQVWLSKQILPTLNYANYDVYRATNFIWSILSFLLLFKVHSRYKQWNKLSVFFLLFFTMSPFVMGMEQFYRYYNLYLFAALGWFWLILLYDHQFSKLRLLFYTTALVSFFVHFLLFWGVAVYLFSKEFSLMSKRYQWILGVTLISGIAGFVLFGSPILRWVFELAGGGNYELPEEGSLTRGFSKALFIKPFFALFTFLFGEKTLPLESHLVNLVYGLSLLSILYGLICLFAQKTRFRLVLTAGIIPFLGLYWFIEPLTLPGMTQFESKHPMFAFPWVLFLWYLTLESEKLALQILGLIPFVGALTGLFHTFNAPHIEWQKAIHTLTQKDRAILHDPSVKSNLLFFGQDQIDTSLLTSIYDTTLAQQRLKNLNQLCIVTQDFKSYQYLDMRQMWNSGTDSGGRFNRIHTIYKGLQAASFAPVSSYVSHPLIVYCFEKPVIDTVKRDSLSHPIPWFFGMPYKDLQWPISINGEHKYSFYPAVKGEKIRVSSNRIQYFIQVKPEVFSAKSPVVKVSFADGSHQLLKLVQDQDTYRQYYSAGLENSDVVYKWAKRPLVSSSHAYTGSIRPSQGYIYEWQSAKIINSVEVLQEGIEMNYVL